MDGVLRDRVSVGFQVEARELTTVGPWCGRGHLTRAAMFWAHLPSNLPWRLTLCQTFSLVSSELSALPTSLASHCAAVRTIWLHFFLCV